MPGCTPGVRVRGRHILPGQRDGAGGMGGGQPGDGRDHRGDLGHSRHQVHRAVNGLRNQSAATENARPRPSGTAPKSSRRLFNSWNHAASHGGPRRPRGPGVPEDCRQAGPWSPRRPSLLGLAGQLHDIGLLAIPAGSLARRVRSAPSNFAASNSTAPSGPNPPAAQDAGRSPPGHPIPS